MFKYAVVETGALHSSHSDGFSRVSWTCKLWRLKSPEKDVLVTNGISLMPSCVCTNVNHCPQSVFCILNCKLVRHVSRKQLVPIQVFTGWDYGQFVCITHIACTLSTEDNKRLHHEKQITAGILRVSPPSDENSGLHIGEKALHQKTKTQHFRNICLSKEAVRACTFQAS